MNQKNKDLLICFAIAFIGIYGSIIDYNTEHNILPSIFPEGTNLEHQFGNTAKTNKMSSVWFMFTIFGIMLTTFNILNLKSKYKGKELVKHYKKIVGDKIDEGKREYKIWRRNKY